jgi:hypothetical protein
MTATSQSERIESILREHLVEYDVGDQAMAKLTEALSNLLVRFGDSNNAESIVAGLVSPYKGMTSEEFAKAWSL